MLGMLRSLKKYLGLETYFQMKKIASKVAVVKVSWNWRTKISQLRYCDLALDSSLYTLIPKVNN